uniref:uncharacterized protein LOC122580916 n=1 Tax=Erigeron canadensis TaxID=72917 RepID=UPI001CB962E0|nr:uncharacterized protein LOC122580916 [Erigeron canadensis]
MGSEYNNTNKPRYDISMSRRTRRPQSRALFGEKVSALKDEEDKVVEEENEEEKRKKRFMEFFGEKEEEEVECRNSLGERFTEEDKQHQLVVIHEKGSDSVSLKKMVSRCAKMWGGLIKIKGGSRKKRVLQLTM